MQESFKGIANSYSKATYHINSIDHHNDNNSCPTCLYLLRIGLATAEALGKRGAHVVVSSRRQANVDKAVALLQSQSIQVTGTTCNVGIGEDREKLVKMVSSNSRE